MRTTLFAFGDILNGCTVCLLDIMIGIMIPVILYLMTER